MTYYSDLSEEALKQRLERLDITMYKIAKAIAEKRTKEELESVTLHNSDGLNSTDLINKQLQKYPATRFHGTITKALDCPEKSSLKILSEIIQAMGGNIKIEWSDVPQKVKRTNQNDERLDILEKEISEIKDMLLELLSAATGSETEK